MTTPEYAEGGFIPGGPVPAYIHPDECLIRARDVRPGRLVCSRPGHPTSGSDCRSTPLRQNAPSPAQESTP